MKLPTPQRAALEAAIYSAENWDHNRPCGVYYFSDDDGSKTSDELCADARENVEHALEFG